MLKVSCIRMMVFAFAATASVQLLAQTWQRTLPVNGKVAVVGEPMPLPLIQLNGKSMRFAPGAVIFDDSNRTILHGALPSNATVLYTTNLNGDVQRVYILTPAEQDQLDRAGSR